MILRFLLVTYFAVCITNARTLPEIKMWFIQMSIECNKEHPVTPEEMMMLQKHKIPESKNAKCLLACVYRKADLMTGNNEFDFDNAGKMIERDFKDNAEKMANSKKVLDACRTVNDDKSFSKDTAGCERSYLMTRCLIENAPKFGFDLKHVHS